MYPLVETIKIEYGKIQNLSFHNERLNRSNRELYNVLKPIDLEDHLLTPPEHLDKKLKCRVIYAGAIRRIEMMEYHLPLIKSVRLVHDDTIDYRYKSTDRTHLDSLYAHRGDADDVLIIKNGSITDSWFANVALLKNGQWYTPDTPLLAGTKRAQLICSGQLTPISVSSTDIDSYEKICLINAMIDLDEITIQSVVAD